MGGERTALLAAIESAVAAVPGVRAVYAASGVTGGGRVVLRGRDGDRRCELRIAVAEEAIAVRLLAEVAAAARAATGDPALRVAVEIASIG